MQTGADCWEAMMVEEQNRLLCWDDNNKSLVSVHCSLWLCELPTSVIVYVVCLTNAWP